ncbi:hypothetical protein [Bacillus mycoides]|uniref:hypothetical protein n=1 Tax=Bacillus mycoides TaxID=1405 RepID=UPI0025A2B4C2|nr:hypothetical protein [Bacillus mycoides]MDM5430889.1 hypothetical protein [Bacillus mycoides]
MTRHYLINTLVNWRESILKGDIQKAYNMCGMTKAETLKMIHLYYDMVYKWYEYKHPKLRELLGKW